MTILKYCKDGKQVEDAHSAAGRAVARDENMVLFLFFFVLIILYSLYLEYDSPLVRSASGLAG